jgi:tetratricopeptide (TPR) repeat protein
MFATSCKRGYNTVVKPSRQRSQRSKGKTPAQTDIDGVQFPKSKDFKWRDQGDRLWLLIIFLVALVVRLVVVWQLFQNNPGFFSPDVDSGWHYAWAQELARGHWLGTEAFYRAPLYPYLLGVWMSVFGDHLLPIRLIQAVIGALSAGLVSLLGWRLFGRRIALTAGFVWALWGPMIYYETELLIPVLIVPLNLLALWLAVGWQRDRNRRLWPWLLVGGILGISAIARPNILIAVPAFLWMAWLVSRTKGGETMTLGSRLKPLIAIVIGVIIPIVPVTVRNYAVSDDFVPIAYQGGINLYIGNNPEADGLTMMMPEVLLDPTVGWDEFVGTTDSIARTEAAADLSPSEISSHWTSKALGYMIKNPGATIGRWLKKIFYLFNGFEAGDQTDIYAFTRFSNVLHLLIHKRPFYIPFGLIAPFALVGMVFAWRWSERTRPLIVFVVLYSLSVILFLATARHRLPIMPLLVIFAAMALWLLVGAWRQRRDKIILPVILGLVGLGIVLNLHTVEDTMENPAFTEYQEALVYDRMGDFKKSVELYEKAVTTQPLFWAAWRNLARALVRTEQYEQAIQASFNYLRTHQDDAEAINNLGLAYLGQGDTAKALGSFRIAAGKNPKLAQPHLNLGDIALARGDGASAVGAYHRGIAADSSYGPIYNALGVLFARAKVFDSAVAVLRLCTQKNPDYPSAWANLGNVLFETDQPEEAVEAIRRAMELNPGVPTMRYNLAAAYVKLGNIDEAKHQLEILLQQVPNYAPAQELLKTLRNPGAVAPADSQ